MANNTTTQASYIQEDPQTDECCENIPPRGPNVVDSSKLENAALNESEIFTSELGEYNVNVFDVHVFSTPAPKKNSEGQAKTRLSGVQSALSPILQYLNIGNRISSPEPFKHQNSPNFTVPFSFPAAKCQKSTGESRKLIGGEDFSMINDECFPEMTLSELTADSMMQLTTNDSVLPECPPATPQLYGKKTHIQTSAGDHKKSSPELPPPATDPRFTAAESFESALSSREIIDNYFQEITLLDISQDSGLSPVSQKSSMDITPVVAPAGHMKASRAASDHSEQIMAATVTNDEVSSTSVDSVQCARQSLIKASLDVTQDVTMGSTLENSRCTSETSDQKVEKSQNSDNGTRVINVTHDLNSSGDTCAQGAGISSSSIDRSIPEFYPEPREKPDSVDADMDGLQASCDTKVSNKGSQQSPESETGGQKVEQCQDSDEDALCSQAINITREINPCSDVSAQTAHLSSSDTDKSFPELQPEPKEKPDSVEAKTEELPTSCDTKSTSEESQQSLKSDVSTNGTFTVEQPSVASVPSDINIPGPVSCHNNETLDLPTANESNPKDVGESSDQQSSVINQSCSGEKERTCSKGQNATFDKDPLQQSKTQIGSFERTPASLGHGNDTFDCKPASQQNSTITLSEMILSDSHQSTLGNASAPTASNSTTTLKEDCSKDHSSKVQKNESAEPDAKKDGSPNRTFEGNPAVEPANGSGGCESKDLLQAGLPVTDSLSDLSNHQSSDTITIKARSFDLDETLDLRAECLTTSTPMPSGKVFNFENKQEAGKVLTVQKKLYGEPPNRPSHTMPSNIICDRKTFFKQSAAKYIYLPSKTAASHLLKGNPAAVATGLPVRSHRTEGEPVRSAAASEEQQAKASTSSCYNLRSLASKLPISGLQRPQPSGLPVGLPGASLGLRPRINTAASSSTEKLSGATAPSAVTKHAQGKKHPLTKGEALPVSKRKRTDTLPSSNTEAPASACDSATGVKMSKQPITSQRAAPDRTSKTVPASTAKTVTSCDASSRGRSLRPPGANQRAHLAKPQIHGCAKCSVLGEKIRLQSEEIQRLKEELLKYKTPVDC
ncbi:uncharacterized protein LOC124875691 isoform X1 [Girardinichthys multiradiatus]|uniref:uncharacterized protein LOC124875691 isoform X1 n=1 Tax=Girardinichthys multiradiatus TaxID=208333 RepID=UPI001FACC97F|nr:uncharacterized protein LOC124875691 isoform X1 [Girardinichthys multiradiatus]